MGTFILGLSMALTLTDAADQQLLAASVRVNLKESSSGTVVKVQKRDNQYKVWILSTGHFRNEVGDKADVEFFYMDGKRLDKPLVQTGVVVYRIEENFMKGVDFSVITLKMDKAPAFIQIAKKGPKKGASCVSTGCDLGSDPKLYRLKIAGYNTTDYKTKRNGPKPGRSGGGLFYNNRLVGVCWGHTGEGGYGLFVSHKQLVKHLMRAGLQHLTEGD